MIWGLCFTVPGETSSLCEVFSWPSLLFQAQCPHRSDLSLTPSWQTEIAKFPDKMCLTFVKTTWRPASPWCWDIFHIPLASSPAGWQPRVTYMSCQAAYSWSWPLTCAGECWPAARSRTRSRWSGSSSRCPARRCPGPASRTRGRGRWRGRAVTPGWGRSQPRNLQHGVLYSTECFLWSLSASACIIIWLAVGSTILTFYHCHQNHRWSAMFLINSQITARAWRQEATEHFCGSCRL